MKLNEKFSIINDDVGVIAVGKRLEELLKKDLADVM